MKHTIRINSTITNNSSSSNILITPTNRNSTTTERVEDLALLLQAVVVVRRIIIITINTKHINTSLTTTEVEMAAVPSLRSYSNSLRCTTEARRVVIRVVVIALPALDRNTEKKRSLTLEIE